MAGHLKNTYYHVKTHQLLVIVVFDNARTFQSSRPDAPIPPQKEPEIDQLEKERLLQLKMENQAKN